MREMKDSGIAWVGNIPEKWSIVANKYVMTKIKHICPEYKGDDILSLTMNGVVVRDLDAGGKMPTSFDGYQILYPCNLLMCLFDYDVTPRCIGLIKNYGITSPAYSQFSLDKGNDASYYYYYYLMLDNEKTLLHLAKNLRHSFTEEQLGAIKIPVPPVAEQKRIASFLDSKCTEIDSISEDIRKEIETLQEYRKSIITEAVTKGLDPDVEMKDSGVEWIGEIPKNWKVSKVKYSSIVLNGDRGSNYPSGNDLTDEGIPFLTSNNIHGDEVDCINSSTKYITEERYMILGGVKLKTNDIIFCLRGSVGLCAINKSENRGTVASSLTVIRPQNIIPEYLNYLLKTDVNTVQTFLFSNGSCAANLSAENVLQYLTVEPQIDEQKAIACFLDAKCAEIDSIIADKQKQLDTLAEYRKSLIYEYVTGKKEVPTT